MHEALGATSSNQQMPSHAFNTVTVFTAICGEDYTRASLPFVRSLHHSTLRHLYSVHLVVLHDGAAFPLIQLIEAARSKGIMRFITLTALQLKPMEHSLFAPCASARLQIPRLYPSMEGVAVWVDADTYVAGSLSKLAGLASQFTASQWAALATEDGYWYKIHGNKTGSSPYFGTSGLNSGVIVFELSRWRRSMFPAFVAHYRGVTAMGTRIS